MPEAAGPGLVFCPESSPVSSPPPAGHQTPQLGSVYRVVRVGAASQTTHRSCSGRGDVAVLFVLGRLCFGADDGQDGEIEDTTPVFAQ